MEKELNLGTQKINKCKEIDIKEFADDKFKCRCPRCGFKFNQEQKKCSAGNGTSKT